MFFALSGSAASKVDLNSGDQLVAMDDTLLAGLDHAEIIRMIQKVFDINNESVDSLFLQASLNGHVMLHIRRIVATGVHLNVVYHMSSSEYHMSSSEYYMS